MKSLHKKYHNTKNAGWKTKMKWGPDEKHIQQKPQKTDNKKFKDHKSSVDHTLGNADLTVGTNTSEEHANNKKNLVYIHVTFNKHSFFCCDCDVILQKRQERP